MSAIPRPVSKLPQVKKGIPELPAEKRILTTSTMPSTGRPLGELNHNRVLKRNASPSFDTDSTAKRAHLRRSKSVVDLRKPTVSKNDPPPFLKRANTKHDLINTKVTKPIPLTRANSRPVLNRMASKSSFQTSTSSSVRNTSQKTAVRPVLNRAKSNLSGTVKKTTTAAPNPAKKPLEFNPDLKTEEFSDFIVMIQRPMSKFTAYDFKAKQEDSNKRFKLLLQKFISVAQDFEKCGDVQGQFNHLTEQVDQLERENTELKANVQDLSEDKHMLEMKTERLQISLDKMTNSFNEAKAEVDFLTSEVGCLKEESGQLKTEVDELSTNLKEVKEKAEFYENEYFGLEIERKRLHNTIMDLKGNIRVFCRIRPSLESEKEKMLCQWKMLDESSFEISGYDSIKKKVSKLDYTFDHTFHQKSSQEDVFENVSPLIQSALDGYNICIFAYGQTGSGKSYTMDGTRENLGIIPRTVDLLFNTIKHLKQCGYTYTITASFLEIYNEVLCDLLDPKPKQMDIKMSSTTDTKDVYVSNIKERQVESAKELRELMDLAKTNRITACTVGNERSSRSHAVTNITVVGRHKDRKYESCKGTINLVDLAGSESPKFSTRMEETKNINRSLSELTNVMLALVKKSAHVPYRNSKLTHLLMPSLGGNSKTLMIVNVNPLEDCFQETNKSLRFAATVNSCTMAKAKKVKIYDQESFKIDE